MRLVAAWIFSVAAIVYVMVVVGGVTRLTRSGLSMVDWRPQGSWLPQDDEAWQAEFDKYKQFPEYRLKNMGMTLEEFKDIYWWEWFHRMLGRGIGLAFALPGAALALGGSIPRALRGRLGLAFALGGTQGLIGWWMVKSGLDHKNYEGENKFKDPRVSPYRLATHLTMAFSIFGLLLWTGFDALSMASAAAAARGSAKAIAAAPTAAATRAAARMLPALTLATGLVGLTSFAGAFVAGNDAGRAYNDWPMYAGRHVPEEIWDDKLGYRNVFENTATVQFDHRNLAYATVAAVGVTMAMWLRSGAAHFPKSANVALAHLGLGVLGQAGLGIVTLMSYVPVELGAAHQGGALALLAAALWSRHAVGRVAGGAGAIQRAAAAGGPTGATAAAAAASVLGLRCLPEGYGRGGSMAVEPRDLGTVRELEDTPGSS